MFGIPTAGPEIANNVSWPGSSASFKSGCDFEVVPLASKQSPAVRGNEVLHRKAPRVWSSVHLTTSLIPAKFHTGIKFVAQGFRIAPRITNLLIDFGTSPPAREIFGDLR